MRIIYYFNPKKELKEKATQFLRDKNFKAHDIVETYLEFSEMKARYGIPEGETVIAFINEGVLEEYKVL